MVEGYTLGGPGEGSFSPTEALLQAGESVRAGAALLLRSLVQIPEQVGGIATHISMKRPARQELPAENPDNVATRDQVPGDRVTPRRNEPQQAPGEPSSGGTTPKHTPQTWQ